MMEPSKTGFIYDSIVERWSDQNFNMQNGIAAHQRALQFTSNSGRGLDVGCGRTGRFIELMLAHGLTPEGIDISKKMLEHAQKKHPFVTFYHKDICEWTPPHQYQFITAWDSIWHVPLNKQASLIKKLVRALSAQGVLIFSFGGVDEAGDHTDDFMGPEVYYSSLGVNGILSLLLELNCVCKHLEFDQYPQVHTYIIVQKL